MNEKRIALAVLGVVIALEGYIANEFFLILAGERYYYVRGSFPNPGPPPIATAWLFLIPVGFMHILISIVLELRDRYRRTDTDEIWN